MFYITKKKKRKYQEDNEISRRTRNIKKNTKRKHGSNFNRYQNFTRCEPQSKLMIREFSDIWRYHEQSPLRHILQSC